MKPQNIGMLYPTLRQTTFKGLGHEMKAYTIECVNFQPAWSKRNTYKKIQLASMKTLTNSQDSSGSRIIILQSFQMQYKSTWIWHRFAARQPLLKQMPFQASITIPTHHATLIHLMQLGKMTIKVSTLAFGLGSPVQNCCSYILYAYGAQYV